MKKAILMTVIIATFLSCNDTNNDNKKIETISDIVKLSATSLKIDSLKKAGKIIVFSEDDYVIAYPKKEVDGLKQIFYKYILTKPLNRAEAYEEYMFNVPSELTKDIVNDFTSESGEDEFALVYTYFFKQKNGIEKYLQERKDLVSIFNIINSFNSELAMGGTMYGHKKSRLHGDVEYAIYEFSKEPEVKNNREFKIQKTKFIKGIQEIVKYDFDIEDEPRKTNISKLIEKLRKEITNSFYLKKAKEFQSFYE